MVKVKNEIKGNRSKEGGWNEYDIVEEKEHGKCARNATTVHLTLGVSNHADFIECVKTSLLQGQGLLEQFRLRSVGYLE